MILFIKGLLTYYIKNIYINMIRMNSIDLLTLKNDPKCAILEEDIISDIVSSFNQSNIKTFKVSKKQVNILKNNKIQIKKDLNENKLVMVMNKLSHNNINELVKEYLSTITISNEDEYYILQNQILEKMIKDITFIDNYIPFVIKIFSIEKYKLSLEPLLFISNIYNIVNHLYYKSENTTNIEITDSENYRSSILMLIKKLIVFNFFNDNMYDYISEILLNQTYYKVDIYYWFDKISNKVLIKYNNDIIENINYCNLNNLKRDALMIESIVQNNKEMSVHTNVSIPKNNTITNKAITNKTITNNTITNNTITNNTIITKPINKTIINKTDEIFTISCQNIIEEYLYLEIIEEVQLFINTECNNKEYDNTFQKSIFCKELLKYYFTNPEKRISILKLYDILIKKKYIFKSNISKGLLIYLEANNINKNDNIESFLKFLKNNNITKNIEHVFKKYKNKIEYQS